LKRGKKFLELIKGLDKQEMMSPFQALKWLKENHYAKFDESVDISFNLGVDPRKADQIVRGTLVLPNGTGKVPRVLVFAAGDKATEATNAGADFVGGEELVEKITGGWLAFDVCITTPDMMKFVGKLGKILGPRKLMPNPKSGTVTMEIEKAVRESKMGRLEYRTDKTGVVHCPIGRLSFELEKLIENYSALFDAVSKAKPSSAKGKYLKGVYLTTTMGPGIKVDAGKHAEMEAVA
jgi:large subunit ribosomal protein L1